MTLLGCLRPVWRCRPGKITLLSHEALRNRKVPGTSARAPSAAVVARNGSQLGPAPGASVGAEVMSNERSRPAPAALLAVVGSLLGLAFGAGSMTDFAAHLDRKVHGVTCSFVPGLISSEGGANACATALYSPYSSLFRRSIWGGVPIAVFALGAFAFFLGMGVWLWRANVSGIPRSVRVAYGALGLTPAGR